MPVYTVVYTIQDEAGKESSTSLNLPSSLTQANAIIAAQEFGKLIDAMIDGAIVNTTMSIDVPLNVGYKAAPLDTSRVSAGARFQFETQNGYPTALRIPTRKESIVVDGSINIDHTVDPALAFKNAMISGIDLTTALPVAGTGTAQPCDTHADDIVVLRKAVEQFVRAPKS